MSIDDGSPISELVVILTAVNDILVSLCIFLGRELDSGGRPERLVEGHHVRLWPQYDRAAIAIAISSP